MLTEPVTTEMVCQVSEIDRKQILKEHFNFLYIILSENQLVPNATFEQMDGVTRCLSGSPNFFHNAVLGSPKSNWDQCIKEQLNFFQSAKMPFVWYVDEDTDPAFKEKLLNHGFQNGGIFQGVIGTLDQAIPDPEIPRDCVLELVDNETALEEFNELVCAIFDMKGVTKEMYKKVMGNATKDEHHPMFHWIARKQGKVVSAVSTLISGDIVSFWNGASLPEVRRHGLNTALRRLALKHAVSKGCRLGSSYLMSEAMPFGICSKLGFQTQWRFNVFLSPQ